MEKEYKLVKDFEGIFDENQLINVEVFDIDKICHFSAFSGEAGIFYQLIRENAKFGQFYGELEVLDMRQSSADEGMLIIMCKNQENTLKDKLQKVKPIVEAKMQIKNKISELIIDKQSDYVEDIEFIKQQLNGMPMNDSDFTKIKIWNNIIEELDDILKRIEAL